MPIYEVTKQFEQAKQQALDWLQKEVATLRSGRIKPELVESLLVESYGTRSPLNGLASVSGSDARTLVISPWDKNIVTDIAKAINEANLGVQPVVDGDVIRLSFPSLTDEVRQQTLKILNDKAEETRIRLRQARDEALRSLREEREHGKITEDDFYDGKQQLDQLINTTNNTIVATVQKKEEEVKAV
jgi:ribosome recycling factor